MRKMSLVCFVAIVAFLALPVTVWAQSPLWVYNSYTRQVIPVGYGGVYNGSYDRSYIGRDFYGRQLPPIEVEECHYRECNGLKGTFHAEKGDLHFRPYDSTHNPAIERHKDCLVIHSLKQSQTPAATRGSVEPEPRRELVGELQQARQDCTGKPLTIENKSGLTVEVKKDGEKFASLPSPDGSNTVCVAEGSYEAWATGFLKGDDRTASVRPVLLDPEVRYNSITLNVPKGR